MSTQPSGVAYLRTHAGALRLLEAALAAAEVVVLAAGGDGPWARPLLALAVAAAAAAAGLAALHACTPGRRPRPPWQWMECAYALAAALLFVVFGCGAFSAGRVAAAVAAYALALVYVLDALDKYREAAHPAPKYAWTTPNMPDLE